MFGRDRRRWGAFRVRNGVLFGVTRGVLERCAKPKRIPPYIESFRLYELVAEVTASQPEQYPMLRSWCGVDMI